MIINFSEIKKYILYCLIASLVVSAIFAVITILMGQFNEFSGRVFSTLFMVMFHALFSLSFVWDDARKKSFERLGNFIDVLFGLIILSFIISTLGIWKIISPATIGHLYQSFFIIGFAVLHADILSKAFGKEDFMDIIIYVNYLVMAIVVLMLLRLIFLDYNVKAFGEILLRFLGAAAIIDGTLSILTIIFYKLYLNKHPKVENAMQAASTPNSSKQSEKKGLSLWVKLLILYLILQIATPVVCFLFIMFIGLNK